MIKAEQTFVRSSSMWSVRSVALASVRVFVPRKALTHTIPQYSVKLIHVWYCIWIFYEYDRCNGGATKPFLYFLFEL